MEFAKAISEDGVLEDLKNIFETTRRGFNLLIENSIEASGWQNNITLSISFPRSQLSFADAQNYVDTYIDVTVLGKDVKAKVEMFLFIGNDVFYPMALTGAGTAVHEQVEQLRSQIIGDISEHARLSTVRLTRNAIATEFRLMILPDAGQAGTIPVPVCCV